MDLVKQQMRFVRDVMMEFYSVLVKEGKILGIMGYVRVLIAMKKESIKINEDDLPRFLSRKFRRVSIYLELFSKSLNIRRNKWNLDKVQAEYLRLKQNYKK